MKKVMISQPMAGLSDEEILRTRDRVIRYLTDAGYDVVNTFFSDEYRNSKDQLKERGIKQIPFYFLSKSLATMSLCDAVYFCKGWEKSRGCFIEHAAAQAYGLDVMYEA